MDSDGRQLEGKRVGGEEGGQGGFPPAVILIITLAPATPKYGPLLYRLIMNMGRVRIIIMPDMHKLSTRRLLEVRNVRNLNKNLDP